MRFRLAKPEDAGRLLEIYQPYVEKTAITFEYEVPSLAEFTERVQNIGTIFPYLVAEKNGKIVGYAYASRYRERAAYDWVVELSIYLDENERHQSIGTQLYQRLLHFLTALNYQRAYACVTYPNPASMDFHKKLGFQEIGVMQKSGYKFDKWYGIAWLDIPLQTDDMVKPIRKMSQLSQAEIEKLLTNK